MIGYAGEVAMAGKADPQKTMLDRYRRAIDDALADSRPSISLDEAFARLDVLSAVRRLDSGAETCQEPDDA
jgi:hypothetical protein